MIVMVEEFVFVFLVVEGFVFVVEGFVSSSSWWWRDSSLPGDGGFRFHLHLLGGGGIDSSLLRLLGGAGIHLHLLVASFVPGPQPAL